MSFKTETIPPNHTPTIYPDGQHLYCHNCGSEVEIVVACKCDPPDMIVQCCGKDMLPTPRPEH